MAAAAMDIAERGAEIAATFRLEDGWPNAIEGASAEPSLNPPTAALSASQPLIIQGRPDHFSIPRSIGKKILAPSPFFELITPTSFWRKASANRN